MSDNTPIRRNLERNAIAGANLFSYGQALVDQTSSLAGGARRDRTDDLLLAKQALSQLSYGPSRDQKSKVRNQT
jgi:hypothetical protein